MNGWERWIFWNRETKYYGSYKNNVRDGNDIYYFGLNYYEGNWVNNISYGLGTLCNDGCKIDSFFRFGKLTKLMSIDGVNKILTQKITQRESKVKNKEKSSNEESGHPIELIEALYKSSITNNTSKHNNNENEVVEKGKKKEKY